MFHVEHMNRKKSSYPKKILFPSTNFSSTNSILNFLIFFLANLNNPLH
jgi:hypothetical protein